CSAGNDATARPQFPAALAPWRVELEPPVHLPVGPKALPLVSVGALNPNSTDAIFSNTGPWVRAWAPGVALVSTLPKWNGGFLPVARVTYEDRVREGFDPDNFASGFGTWSGTSFAAPLLAGRIATALLSAMPASEDEARQTAVERGWQAVQEHTELRLLTS
ncbi:MAG: S8 family serine peptidase, partial [Gammaproteobacteria bacterium]